MHRKPEPLSCPFSAAPAKIQLAAPTLLVITTSWSIPNPSWFHWKHIADLGDRVVGKREPVVDSSRRDIIYLNPIHQRGVGGRSINRVTGEGGITRLLAHGALRERMEAARVTDARERNCRVQVHVCGCVACVVRLKDRS